MGWFVLALAYSSQFTVNLVVIWDYDHFLKSTNCLGSYSSGLLFVKYVLCSLLALVPVGELVRGFYIFLC